LPELALPQILIGFIFFGSGSIVQLSMSRAVGVPHFIG
jgi:hypothetical protein